MKNKYIKEQESLLLKQAKLMAMFAELDPDPVFRFDPQGKILLANEAGTNLINSNYIIGKNLSDLIPIFKEINFIECIKTGKKISISISYNKKYYQFIVHGFPELEIGQIYGRDITEQKNIERDLKKALEKAKESERLKSEFLKQISHEVRTPLNSIIGYSSLLKEELDKNYNSDLYVLTLGIENSGKRLFRTIDKILNMAQLHTGRYEKYFENINLFELLKKLHKENISFAEEKNLSFNLYNKTGEREVFVYGDSYSINLIFINIIENALKYTHKGNVDIVLYKEDNDLICVKVIDSGIGIKREYQQKIFTPFTQEETGYSRSYDGTGLGLALSKRFAEINNMDIKIESEKSQGTTFTVIFKGIK